MAKYKAIELLKQYVTEIPKLRELHYDNQDYELWVSKIKDVIKAWLDQDDYDTFVSARSGSIPIRGLAPENRFIEYYQENINAKETAIKKIIQKYEILGIDTEKFIEVPPEEIFRETPPQAFISHGKESAALHKLKEFIETLGIEPLIVKKRASLDKDLPDKVNLYLSQADFVIVLATGDDTVTDEKTGTATQQPRQNVIHEIGLAQNTHSGRIIYLLEEGAEFPSNIRPRVWESFKQRNMMNAFLGILRELRAYGILEVTKYPINKGASS